MSFRNAPDPVQRALNDAKRRNLEERFGATFSGTSSGLPPEVERKWLEYVEELEELFEKAEMTTVRMFVGNPPVRLLGEIPPAELSRELNRLLLILDANDISVHFPEDLSDAEKYRSITEELLDTETEDIRVDGMLHLFCYGDSADGEDDSVSPE